MAEQPRGEDGQFTGYLAECAPLVFEAVAEGASNRTAASYAGIDESTLRDWISRGEGDGGAKSDRGDPRGQYAAFLVLFRKARGSWLMKHTRRLNEREPDPVEAANARFVLERRDSEAWGRSGKQDVTLHTPDAPTVIIED